MSHFTWCFQLTLIVIVFLRTDKYRLISNLVISFHLEWRAYFWKLIEAIFTFPFVLQRQSFYDIFFNTKIHLLVFSALLYLLRERERSQRFIGWCVLCFFQNILLYWFTCGYKKKATEKPKRWSLICKKHGPMESRKWRQS